MSDEQIESNELIESGELIEPMVPSDWEAPLPTYAKRRRRWPVAVAIIVVIAVLLGAFYVTEWDDFSYVLGPSPEAKAADAQLAEELSDCYAYNQLSADDQVKYRIFVRAWQTGEQQPYPVNDVKDLETVALFVEADHALIPDVGEFRLHGGGIFTPAYAELHRYDGEAETQARMERIAAAADECIASLPDGADDYAKSKYVYEWLADHVDYDDSVFDGAKGSIAMPSGADPDDYGQTAGNALVDGRAVCAGYSRAFQYLMQRLGLQCLYVTGYVAYEGTEEYHAWNVVRLDGEYYLVDATWGDPAYFDVESEEEIYYTVDYDYLNVTTDYLSVTHTADEDIPLPECTSMADNYYVREGLYFETADRDRVGALFAAAVPGASNTVFFRCATREIYDDLYAFIDSGGLLAYANVDYHYFDMEETLVLGFFRDTE